MGELKDKIKDIFIALDKKANMHEVNKANQQIGKSSENLWAIDDLKTKKTQLSKDLEAVKKQLGEKIA